MAREDDRTSARDAGKEDPERRGPRDPGKTPGQAEGDRETVEEELRRKQQQRRG